MNRVVTIAKNFINLAYPLHCLSCKKTLDPECELGVCQYCLSQIRPNPKPHCRLCGRSLQNAKDRCSECRTSRFSFERAYSACLYEGVLKDLIHAFKYEGKRRLDKLFSKLMIDFIKDDAHLLDDINLITFVPIQSGHLRKRGFNQSELLAINMSKEFGIKILDTLEKSRPTRPQNELSKRERLENLKGAFESKKDAAMIEGSGILFIDDVMTTGATLNECSRVLLDAGAKTVRCLTLARGV